MANLIQKAKAKVIDVASDVMSAPARIKANNAATKATQDVADIKTVRVAKGMPDQGNESDPLFRARTNVVNLKLDSEQAAQESAKKQAVAKKVSSKPSDYGSDYALMMSGKKTRF